MAKIRIFRWVLMFSGFALKTVELYYAHEKDGRLANEWEPRAWMVWRAETGTDAKTRRKQGDND